MSHFHRALKFENGKSHKFWKITHSEGVRHYTVRYGRIGTSGQEREKEFPTSFQARSAAMKIFGEKLAKGYVDVTPTPAAKPKPAPNPPRPEAYAEEDSGSGRPSLAFADDFQAFVKGKS